MKSEQGPLPDQPVWKPVSDGRRTTRLVWSIALVSIAMTLPAKLPADQPLAAYEDPAAAGRPLESLAALSWGREISVIDGSAPDPWVSDRRAWLAPGRHGVYFFGTVPTTGKCPPVTGDELAELEVEAGRSYLIAARQSASEPESGPVPGCHIELTVADVTGPGPALGPSERLARARARRRTPPRAVAADRACGGRGRPRCLRQPGALVPAGRRTLAVARSGRGTGLVGRCSRARLPPRRIDARRLEPTLTAGQRQAAAERAASPPSPHLGAQDAQR